MYLSLDIEDSVGLLVPKQYTVNNKYGDLSQCRHTGAKTQNRFVLVVKNDDGFCMSIFKSSFLKTSYSRIPGAGSNTTNPRRNKDVRLS